MAKDPLKKLPPKTFGALKVISMTPDTFTVETNGIHNIVSVKGLMIVPYNAQTNEKTGQDSDLQNAKY